MGPGSGQRPGESANHHLQPQVWRISRQEQGKSANLEQSARVWRIFQVKARGEWGIAELAAAQRGVVHLDQLAACGIGQGAIEYRRSVGRLHPVFPSVLAVGSPNLAPLALEIAALLSVGDDSFLSHRTAAVLWKMLRLRLGDPVELTTLHQGCRTRAGLRCHRVPAIDLRDLQLHHGLPVTAPARTLIDLAASATAAETAEALNEARMLKLVTDESIEAALDRNQGRPGTGRLRSVIEAEHGRGYTQRQFERRFRALIASAQLPAPQFNAPLLDYRVDVLWARERVVVELDGEGPHGRPRSFHADRRRDQRLAAAGYVVLRITWPQLLHEPQAVLVRVAQTLAVAATRLGLE